MTTTTTTEMSNSVVTAYDRDYVDAFLTGRVWFELVDWQKPVGGDLKGSTISQPVLEELEPATAALSEGTDPEAVQMDDDHVDIVIVEQGNAIETTAFLSMTAYTNIEAAAARAVGQNQARSLDLVIRAVATTGTLVMYPGAVAARIDLDTTTDKLTYAFICELVSMAESMGIPPYEDGTYATTIHPALFSDLTGMTEYKAVGEYSDPKLIYMGKPGVIGAGGRFKSERGMIGGLRLIEHRTAKLFLGAGTMAQAATTLDGGVAAGDTACDLVSASGVIVGDYITIAAGTALEEQVRVLTVATNALTIRGGGNKYTNFGFKYGHLTGVDVQEAPNVAALPVFGPQSIRGRFVSETGMNGRAAVEWLSTRIPKRKMAHSWYWVGGFAAMQKWLIRGEVATTGNIYGSNR